MTSAGYVSEVRHVMDAVYGPCDDVTSWRPRPYADNKRRYLWTDAFGVCNYLNLYYKTGEQPFLRQVRAS